MVTAREPDSIQEFVEDQLSGLGRVEIRRMFGGAGIYKDGVFFGILYKERLYFRTDETSRHEYLSRGMGVFTPDPEHPFKNYHEVPIEILENAAALAEWAGRAVACQLAEGKPRPRKASEKPKNTKKRSAARGR